MITVTGKIENAAGTTLHATIDFISKSTPLVGAGGVITTNTDKTIRSNPNDGTFSVPLAPGNYQVSIAAENETTTFSIAVPNATGTISIENLVTTPLAYPYLAPNTLWNGIQAGQITFAPIANPPAVTTSPEIYPGGRQIGIDAFAYVIAWQAVDGSLTMAGADCFSSGPSSPNNATRIQLPAPPSGVVAVNIYRSTNDNTTNRYLLASVQPSAGSYDDWESTADFNARLAPPYIPQVAPKYNTTAGQFFASNNPGSAAVLWLTDQGAVFFLNITLDGPNNLAPSQSITGPGSILTKGLADLLYAPLTPGSSPTADSTTTTADSTTPTADSTTPTADSTTPTADSTTPTADSQ